jgi:DNA-directed RNA polymerase subunit RPC12/RpoP
MIEFKLKCLRCDHEWLRRDLKKKPVQCPECHSAYWNRPRVAVTNGADASSKIATAKKQAKHG